MAWAYHKKLSNVKSWDCPRRALGMTWTPQQGCVHTRQSMGLLKLFEGQGIDLAGVVDGHLDRWAHIRNPRERVLQALTDLSKGIEYNPGEDVDDIPFYEGHSFWSK